MGFGERKVEEEIVHIQCNRVNGTGKARCRVAFASMQDREQIGTESLFRDRGRWGRGQVDKTATAVENLNTFKTTQQDLFHHHLLLALDDFHLRYARCSLLTPRSCLQI